MADFWDLATDLSKQWSTPLAERLIWNRPVTQESEGRLLQEERIRLDRLNGSGPVDAQASRNAPNSLFEFILGKQTGAGGAVNYNYVPLMLFAGLALAAFWFLARR